MQESKLTFVSGHSENFYVKLRFPDPQLAPANTLCLLLMSLVPPYQLPLPILGVDMDKHTFKRLWDSDPLYVYYENVVSVGSSRDIRFLGAMKWRVVTTDLEPPNTATGHISSMTRVVYKGLDSDDVSYFVTGCRVDLGSVSYLDVFAYARGSSKPVTNSVIWQPFTLVVSSSIVDPLMKLEHQCQNWDKIVDPAGPLCSTPISDDVEGVVVRRDWFPIISAVRDLIGGIYDTVVSCVGK